MKTEQPGKNQKTQKSNNRSKQASSPRSPTPGQWGEMNRKQRRAMMRKMQSEDVTLEVVHPDAAGIEYRQ